jgi:hypothetical protein
VHLYGSNNPTGFTITNAANVATIAGNINTGTGFQLASGGHNWQYCTDDLRIDGPAVSYCGSCDNGDCLRPLNSFAGNWGGLNGATCGAGTQTITLEFTYDAPNVDLGVDAAFCNSGTLYAGNPGSTYLWSDASTADSLVVTITGNYFVTVSNACGTATDTISIIINSSTSSVQSDTACESYLWNGNTLNLSGTYYDTIPNLSGCDSIMTLNLTIKHNSSSADSISDCISYTWIGNTYYTSGTYRDTIPNFSGCDSIMTLNLIITIPDTGVTAAGDTLTANASSVTYQWVDCNNNYVFIAGATNQSFTADSGSFAVIINDNGCVDTSSCYQILSTTGIQQLQDENALLVYYSNGNLSIMSKTNGSLFIINNLGQVIEELNLERTNSQYTATVANLREGIYFIQVRNSTREITKKIIILK